MGLALVVLAGGEGSRINSFKPLVKLKGRPLIAWVLQGVPCADEVIVVVRSFEQGEMLRKELREYEFALVYDVSRIRSPLVALFSGALAASRDKVLVAPCDAPFVSPRYVDVLLKAAEQGADAVVPRWPNGFTEPLLALYRRGSLIRASLEALSMNLRRASSVLNFMQKVVYVDATKLPREAFMNVNTVEDLATAERIAESLLQRQSPRACSLSSASS